MFSVTRVKFRRAHLPPRLASNQQIAQENKKAIQGGADFYLALPGRMETNEDS
jgi:hypothetical protein